MWPSRIFFNATKASFSKYGYTSHARRIRPLVFRAGLCFSLSMGVLLMGVGWNMTTFLFSPGEIRETQWVMKDIVVNTSRLSPAWMIHSFLVPQPEETFREKEYTTLQFNMDKQHKGETRTGNDFNSGPESSARLPNSPTVLESAIQVNSPK